MTTSPTTTSKAGGTHTWFIGDIHGCLQELVALERLATARSARYDAEPRFVAVGDLVDRGPNSAGVVAHFRRGAERGTHAAILGNHEEMMLRALRAHAPWCFEGIPFSPHVSPEEEYRDTRPQSLWLTEEDFRTYLRLTWVTQGGAQALMSWRLDPRYPKSWRLPPEDVRFLCSLPVLYETDRAIATHALIDHAVLSVLQEDGPSDPRHRETAQRALWSRRLPDGPVDTRVHVSGHTPLTRVRRYRDRRLVRIDTGCCFGNRLSAWCAELDQTVSVRCGAR